MDSSTAAGRAVDTNRWLDIDGLVVREILLGNAEGELRGRAFRDLGAWCVMVATAG